LYNRRLLMLVAALVLPQPGLADEPAYPRQRPLTSAASSRPASRRTSRRAQAPGRTTCSPGPSVKGSATTAGRCRRCATRCRRRGCPRLSVQGLRWGPDRSPSRSRLPRPATRKRSAATWSASRTAPAATRPGKRRAIPAFSPAAGAATSLVSLELEPIALNRAPW